MADDYARHALSQRAAFEATFPEVLAVARLFADEPVLRVVDLGAWTGSTPTASSAISWRSAPAAP
jgi:hypothetical protein